MNPAHFDIHIGGRTSRGFHIQANTYVGSTPSWFAPPYTQEELEQVVEALAGRIHPRQGDPQGSVDINFISVGTKIFKALFHGTLANLLEQAFNEQKPFRLRLHFDPKDPDFDYLNLFPWEAMWRKSAFLCEDRAAPLARCLSFCPTRAQTAPMDKLRALVAVSLPQGMSNPDWADEYGYFFDGWGEHPLVEKNIWLQPRIEDLRDRLRQGYDVFHFLGHGGFVPGKGGYLTFLDGRDRPQAIGGETLGRLVRGAPDLKLVFLSACNTVKVDDPHSLFPFRGVAAALLQQGVPAVLANQFSIGHRAASKMAATVYQRLLDGDSLDHAVTEGRITLETEGDGLEFATPVLFDHCDNSLVFNLPKTPRAQTSSDGPLRVTINTVLPNLNLQNEDLWLDWTDHFGGDSLKGHLPLVPEVWNQTLLPQLWRLQRSVPADRPIFVRGPARLSVWVAFGFVFMSTRGQALHFEQYNYVTGSREVWRTDEKPQAMSVATEPIDIASRGDELAISLSITHPTVKAVKTYLAGEEAPPVGHYVNIFMHSGSGRDSVIDCTAALGLARAASNAMRTIIDEHQPAKTHLFLSAPAGLAMFFGRELNAMGPIQVYEHLNPGYMPSFLLKI